MEPTAPPPARLSRPGAPAGGLANPAVPPAMPASVPDTSAAAVAADEQRTAGAAGAPQTAAVVAAHGFVWRDQEITQPIGGPVPRRSWSVRTLGAEVIVEGGDAVGFGRSRTPLDYFMAKFPQDQLTRTCELTSSKLSARRMRVLPRHDVACGNAIVASFSVVSLAAENRAIDDPCHKCSATTEWLVAKAMWRHIVAGAATRVVETSHPDWLPSRGNFWKILDAPVGNVTILPSRRRVL